MPIAAPERVRERSGAGASRDRANHNLVHVTATTYSASTIPFLKEREIRMQIEEGEMAVRGTETD